MAQINKVNVSDTTYDISQSPDATFTATSNDNTSPTSWTDVAVLASGETNSSIFSKISSMFKNIRFLYSKLGTSDFSSAGDTVSAALAALESGKSDTDHTHTAATTAAAGFMPALNGNSAMCLLGDGTWGTAGSTYATVTTAAPGLAPTLSGNADTCLLGDGTWGTAGSTYANVSTTAPGLAPTLSGTATQYLNGAGNWTTPPDNNTTYATFTSAANGLVPAAKSGTTNWATSGYVLTGAGWAAGTKYNTDTNTTYANFTSAAAGLVPAAKSGSTNIATTAYVLTGAGWAAGTKYNVDNNTTYAFSNGNPTLSWGNKSTVGTVGGVALTVTMPANPNTNTTYGTNVGCLMLDVMVLLVAQH